MKIDAMMPKWDFTNEMPYYTAVIWQTNQNGLSHHCSTNHGQSDHLVVLPEFIAKKYKNRKIKSLFILIDDLENISFIDAHYGHYSADGYTVRHLFDFFDNRTEKDVTKAYRV